MNKQRFVVCSDGNDINILNKKPNEGWSIVEWRTEKFVTVCGEEYTKFYFVIEKYFI